jgi:hypothetical protein
MKRYIATLAAAAFVCSLSTLVLGDELVRTWPNRAPIQYTPYYGEQTAQLQCKNGGVWCGGVCCSKGQVCCGPSPTSKYCANKCDKNL